MKTRPVKGIEELMICNHYADKASLELSLGPGKVGLGEPDSPFRLACARTFAILYVKHK